MHCRLTSFISLWSSEKKKKGKQTLSWSVMENAATFICLFIDGLIDSSEASKLTLSQKDNFKCFGVWGKAMRNFKTKDVFKNS